MYGCRRPSASSPLVSDIMSVRILIQDLVPAARLAWSGNTLCDAARRFNAAFLLYGSVYGGQAKGRWDRNLEKIMPISTASRA